MKKAKLCYTDTDSFNVYLRIDDIYKDKAEYVKTRFDTLNYELDKSLLSRKNQKSCWIHERRIRRKNFDKIC